MISSVIVTFLGLWSVGYIVNLGAMILDTHTRYATIDYLVEPALWWYRAGCWIAEHWRGER